MDLQERVKSICHDFEDTGIPICWVETDGKKQYKKLIPMPLCSISDQWCASVSDLLSAHDISLG